MEGSSYRDSTVYKKPCQVKALRGADLPKGDSSDVPTSINIILP